MLGYNTQPLVSVDFNHDPRSSIFDANHTKVSGRLVKAMAWYDNEWGFSNRMLDSALALAAARDRRASAELAPTARLQRQQAQVGLGEDQSLLGLVRALPGTDFLARTPAATAHVGIELTDIDARTFQAFPFFGADRNRSSPVTSRQAAGRRPGGNDYRADRAARGHSASASRRLS